MYYIDGLQLLINPFNWIIAQRFFRWGALIVSLLSNCGYVHFNWRYLQIGRIWRYLQMNCRYLQMNCRYLQIGLFGDICNSIADIFNWIGDISNSIADMCTSIGDIFNSVNKCENGAPYNYGHFKTRQSELPDFFPDQITTSAFRKLGNLNCPILPAFLVRR